MTRPYILIFTFSFPTSGRCFLSAEDAGFAAKVFKFRKISIQYIFSISSSYTIRIRKATTSYNIFSSLASWKRPNCLAGIICLHEDSLIIFCEIENISLEEVPMKKLLMMSAVLVFAILLVAGCSISINGGTYRVTGYVDTYLNVDVWSPANLTIWQGSTGYSVPISIPLTSPDQHSSYSLSHIPLGTSTIELDFGCSGVNAVTRYRLNGAPYTNAGLSAGLTGVGPAPYNWIVLISGIVIGGDTTIDFDIR